MPDEELRITVNRNPEMPQKPGLLEAREKSQAFGASLEEARNAARANLSEQPRAGHIERVPEERPELPEAPPEDVESVDVELPNGHVVEFGPPNDVSLTMRVIRLIGDQASEQLTNRVYKILLSIRSIDGVPVTPITNTIEADKLANKIGDAGFDVLAMIMLTYWPGAQKKDLKILKKNQRK